MLLCDSGHVRTRHRDRRDAPERDGECGARRFLARSSSMTSYRAPGRDRTAAEDRAGGERRGGGHRLSTRRRPKRSSFGAPGRRARRRAPRRSRRRRLGGPDTLDRVHRLGRGDPPRHVRNPAGGVWRRLTRASSSSSSSSSSSDAVVLELVPARATGLLVAVAGLPRSSACPTSSWSSRSAPTRRGTRRRSQVRCPAR